MTTRERGKNIEMERNILKLTGVYWLAELNDTNEYKKQKKRKKIQNVTREAQQKKTMYTQQKFKNKTKCTIKNENVIKMEYNM